MMRCCRLLLPGFVFLIGLAAHPAPAAEFLKLEEKSHLSLIGGGLGARMLAYGHFETEVLRRYPAHQLVIRNLCDDADTPAYRPHAGRDNPYAFPGGEKYYPLSQAKERHGSGHAGVGFAETPDQWLTRLNTDVLVAFFGSAESFRGAAGLESFRAELTDFVRHTLNQKYNGRGAPQLALVSPIAFQNLSATHGTPDGQVENANLALYTAVIEEVARQHNLLFVNLFSVTKNWFNTSPRPLTHDGLFLTPEGYQRLAPVLADALFGPAEPRGDRDRVLAAVQEKNWLWEKYFKIPNGVHVFGRRHKPFGPDNYPHELKKLEEMIAVRDQAIWAALAGQTFDLEAADRATHPLPRIQTNYKVDGKTGSTEYKYGDQALASMKVPAGYRIELFASEKEFPNLANPVQMSFDNRGRLWVATMPSYPHYQPGDPRPSDKILIFEDTDGDGKADKETIFAENLHLPLGFEFAPEGVYVSQAPHLVLLRDTDGDDRADAMEIVLSGFDDHDTHHAISAFCADPSGAIVMAEGVFLHSNIETPWGPVYSSNGGFFRYDPRRRHLERTARLGIPNPWGIAFDDWGQDFFAQTSSPDVHWMLPGSVQVPYGEFAPLPPNLIEKGHMVRPTSGLEFVSSRHFPDEVQGDLLIHNNIGFLGTKQHVIEDDGTGYKSRHRQDLLQSSDGNFRPVDMEFAPDGSLYLVDWHNVLVGHMQHSARDPLRDHVHGRIYRITYPARPLVEPAPVHGAPIARLLENLKLPEYRTRYRSRRELRARPAAEVLAALKSWTGSLDSADPRLEHHLLEALWTSWGTGRVDVPLLERLLQARDFRVRAAAVRVLRYNGHQVKNQTELLTRAARDDHGRVRLEAIVAASWLPTAQGLPIVQEAAKKPIDSWIKPVLETAQATLTGRTLQAEPESAVPETHLTGAARELFIKGAEVYRREGHCITCHQKDGMGLPAAQFPPIAGTNWVQGNPERLIRLTLHGLMGPIEVNGVKYPGQVPMTPFKGLSDEEIAAVLTYTRNSFGNKASPITPEQVKAVREATKDMTGFYQPESLLREFPD